MEDKTNQIYDKVFKRILTLSSLSVIRFINAMFEKDFPIDSEILYEWTENITDKLNRTLADSIITINNNKFHLEAQINNDKTIVFRVFDYGFQNALKYKINKGNKMILKFPKPKIIFLEHNKRTPDEFTLKLDFQEQGTFEYKVSTMKFLNYSIEELDEQNMVILMPLYLLKLRKEIKKNKTKENALALKKLMNDGIIKSIVYNASKGNITHEDSLVLLGLLEKMYRHLYSNIEILEKEGVDNMLNERLILDFEIKFEKEMKEKLEEKLEEKLREEREKTKIETEKIMYLANFKLEKEKEAMQKENLKRIKEEKEAMQKENLKRIKEEKEAMQKENLKRIKEEKQQMAKEMLLSGLSIENVSKITKLSINEINEL